MTFPARAWFSNIEAVALLRADKVLALLPVRNDSDVVFYLESAWKQEI